MGKVHLYDHQLDFEENKKHGPFGDYADHKIVHKNEGEPSYDFFGTSVHSPFGIAAGPLPTAKHISAALKKGFDIVTLKSVRTDEFPIHPHPHVHAVKFKGNFYPHKPEKVKTHHEFNYGKMFAVANSFGIPSVKPVEWQKYMRESFKTVGEGQALLVAFQGTARGKGRDEFVEDHVTGVSLIKETGAKVVEINLSCPNEGEAVLACFDTEITEKIVKAVRKAHPDIKLIIKLAYFADHEQLKDLVKRVGKYLDGISAINTIPVEVIHEDGEEAFTGRPMAGLSGAPIKWAGLEMTHLLAQYRELFGYDYKILGMGGVLSADDFHEYREAGADFVLSVTGAMWNPNLAAEIKASL
jgi:dihydroorotate dehydrogenase